MVIYNKMVCKVLMIDFINFLYYSNEMIGI